MWGPPEVKRVLEGETAHGGSLVLVKETTGVVCLETDERAVLHRIAVDIPHAGRDRVLKGTDPQAGYIQVCGSQGERMPLPPAPP